MTISIAITTGVQAAVSREMTITNRREAVVQPMIVAKPAPAKSDPVPRFGLVLSVGLIPVPAQEQAWRRSRLARSANRQC